MDLDLIRALANSMTSRHGTRDPAVLLRDAGVIYLTLSMGNSESACKGFYMECSRTSSVVVNSDLDEDMQRFVAAHEAGHYAVHRGMRRGVFRDTELFSDTSRFEYEANIFASELLLSDDAVSDALMDTRDFFAASRLLSVPPELLDFKLRSMKRAGISRLTAPITACGDFLRKSPVALLTGLDAE